MKSTEVRELTGAALTLLFARGGGAGFERV